MEKNAFVGIQHDGKLIFSQNRKSINLVTDKTSIGKIFATKKIKELKRYGNVSK